MKKYITVILLFISTLAFSQSKKEILAQKWKLNKVVDFGQEFDPMDNQKNDWLDFTDDGKFKGVIEGNHVEGSWSATDSKVVVTVDKKLSKTKINWTKVKEVEAGKFALEYQNGDLITSVLLFIPEK